MSARDFAGAAGAIAMQSLPYVLVGALAAHGHFVAAGVVYAAQVVFCLRMAAVLEAEEAEETGR